MIRKILLGVLGIFSLAFGAVAHAGPILWESGINVDGDLTPGGVDISLFDLITGLGSIEVTVSGAGDHVVIGFIDYEIDETTDTFYNETGSAVGTAAAGQTWEIDEPGFGNPEDYFGDIYENFIDSDSTIGSWLDDRVFFDGIVGWTLFDASSTAFDDVAMALGWDFTLAVDEIATILFSASTTVPTNDFYLWQIDDETGASVYLTSALSIDDGGTTVPEPGTLWLFGAGLLALGLSRRRLNKI